MRIGKVTANAGIVLYSLAVSLLLLEAGIRVYLAVVAPKMMVLDERLGWKHAANVSRTFVNEDGEAVRVVQNANGHRGTFRSVERSPNKFRILTLGDSQTEAVQVSETDVFTARIEQTDPRLEVLNAGVGGYNTVQEYLYLASEGLRFHPDLVLLMLCENDLTDNGIPYSAGFGPRPYASSEHGTSQIVQKLIASPFERFILPVPFRMALNSYSYFYYFINSRIYQGLFAEQMLELQKQDVRQLDRATQFGMLYMILDKMSALLDEHNARLLVMLVPDRENVAAGTFEDGARISEHCAAKNIRCLSLMERFRTEAASKTRLYFETDVHWTKEGHKIAAEEIARYLNSTREIQTRITESSN